MCAAASEYFPVGHDVDVEDNDTGDTDPVRAQANVQLCFSFQQRSFKSKNKLIKNIKNLVK